MTDLPTTVSPEDMRRHQEAKIAYGHALEVVALVDELLAARYRMNWKAGDSYDVPTGLIKRAAKPATPEATPTPPSAPAAQPEALVTRVVERNLHGLAPMMDSSA